MRTLSGLLREADEKVELLRRQVGVLSANDDAMLRNVDEEVAGFDDLRGFCTGCAAAAQLRANAGLQLLDAEGLGDVVVGACVERFDFHQVLIADGQNDDGNLRDGANLAAELNSVHLRHGDIGDDEVRFPCVDGLHSLDAVGGDPQRIALRGERGAQDAGDLRFVVDDENLRLLIVLVRFHSRSECWVTMWTSTLGDSFRKC